MNTTTTIPNSTEALIHMLVFPRFILNLDQDLEKRFLGNVLSEICDSAQESKAPILIAFIASPLKKREEALASWRAAQVKSLLSDPVMATRAEAFLKTASPEIVESFHLGKIALTTLDSEIKNRFVATQSDQINDRRAAKNRLYDVVRLNLHDYQEEKHFGKVLPRHSVRLENGKEENFRYRRNAIRFAKESGMAYMIIGFDLSKVTTGNLGASSVNSNFEDEEEEAKLMDEIDDFEDQARAGEADDVEE